MDYLTGSGNVVVYEYKINLYKSTLTLFLYDISYIFLVFKINILEIRHDVRLFAFLPWNCGKTCMFLDKYV